MPQKVIYVGEADLQVWQEAESIAGPRGMSGFVVSAVSRAVEEKKRETARDGEFVRIEVPDTVSGGAVVTKAFLGRNVAFLDHAPEGHLAVYETRRGRYVVEDQVGYSPSMRTYETVNELLDDERLPEDLRAQVSQDMGDVLELDL